MARRRRRVGTPTTRGRRFAARLPRIELVKTRAGVHFRAKAGNGETVAVGEKHAATSKAVRSFQALIRICCGPFAYVHIVNGRRVK